MSEPIEREDTDHGVAPLTERPAENEQDQGTDHPKDPYPTSNDLRAAAPVDLDATVNLTGDLDATVNLTGGEVLLPERDDASVTSDVTRGHLKGLLEALVFASDRPIKAGDLARTATAPTKQVKELLEELKSEYVARGMQLDEVAGGWIFRTNAAYAPFVRDLTKQKPVKLTRAQIETLSILAYRQPITRPEIDDIRGVDCGPVLKLLLERDLVRILGKKDEPGRPIIYGTTTQFLEFFGLKSLRDLPTLREFTDLNEDSRRVVEKELGETLESTAEERGAIEHATPSDTLPPGLDDESGTSPMNTEIPPAMSTSEDMDAEAANGETPNAKSGGEIDPEEEFPDDDDADFDDDEDDDEEGDEDEDEEDEKSE